ncbi:MAG: hypothetical protein AAF236_03995 [Verrucomicrobiota bacterium]
MLRSAGGEFWEVTLDGKVSFHASDGVATENSRLCPDFPSQIEL